MCLFSFNMNMVRGQLLIVRPADSLVWLLPVSSLFRVRARTNSGLRSRAVNIRDGPLGRNYGGKNAAQRFLNGSDTSTL